MRNYRPKVYINKISVLITGSALITFVLIIRLFSLQILEHDYYQNMATAYQSGYTELPAQRGEILITDYHSEEEFLLATNTTLNLLYVDPTLINDPTYVASKLAPLLFDIEDERATDNERIYEASRKLAPELTQEEIDEILRPLSDNELEINFIEDLSSKIGAKIRSEILLATDLEEEKLTAIKSINVTGVEVIDDDVYAYPPEIHNTKYTAEAISEFVEIPITRLDQVLKGENRYVVLKRKLDPDTTEAIEKMIEEEPEQFEGLGMKEEYFRYYPEDSLAANILGYVNRENVGQYGIESAFNTKLQGKTGKFQGKQDSVGRQITVGESIIETAVDGDDIVLTIDRSIQLQVEKILAEAVEEYQAESGQVLIMNPQTGEVIAMAHYPTFDPNNYGDVFEMEEVNLSAEEIESLYETGDEGVYRFYTNAVTLAYYLVFTEQDEEGKTHYYKYVNDVGPEVYHNKIVSWPYEPGSVYKSIAMSIGLDDGDITPNTTYNDVGPIEVDYNVYSGEYDFEIKNSDGYYGLVNMSTVLGKSLNTGMTFIANKIGPALFYSYMEKFGLLDRTDIEFDNEVAGKVEYYEDWSESELATHSFGQGLTVNMVQLANAYCTIANGGILMQPYIIKEIRHDDGTVTTTDSHELRRVISEDTSAKMTAMLTESTEIGVAANAQVDRHFVAGKTGTSQTYKYGQALSGKGTTLTHFAGYGPVNDPRFVIIIKFDHPKQSEWGSATAAPTFSKIAEYLFNYYNIPPDK